MTVMNESTFEISDREITLVISGLKLTTEVLQHVSADRQRDPQLSELVLCLTETFSLSFSPATHEPHRFLHAVHSHSIHTDSIK